MAQNPNTSNPWKYGLFYYDESDLRVWVPKKIPVFGWTLNYAHKFSWVFTLGIVVLIVYTVYSGNARVNLP